MFILNNIEKWINLLRIYITPKHHKVLKANFFRNMVKKKHPLATLRPGLERMQQHQDRCAQELVELLVEIIAMSP